MRWPITGTAWSPPTDHANPGYRFTGSTWVLRPDLRWGASTSADANPGVGAASTKALKLLGDACEDRTARPVLVGENADPGLAAQQVNFVEQIDDTEAQRDR